MSATVSAKDLFFTLTEHATSRATAREVLLLEFSGEESDFVRFNRTRVGQATAVRQYYLTLTLIEGKRQDATTLALSGDLASDRIAIERSLADMRRDLPTLPEDPHLLYCEQALQSNSERAGRLPSASEATDAILAAAAGVDLVGIFACGPMYRGFANSLGSRCWHAVDSFLFDWSLFHARDKAVKCSWAGQKWDPIELRRRIEIAREQLPLLAAPERGLDPGTYRAYLAPAALDELLSLFNWDGVSAKAQRTRQSPLQRLVDGAASLSPLFSLSENTAGGLAPSFDKVGFPRPHRVDLIRAGRHVDALVGPRSAREYGIQANGAGDEEAMKSLDLAPGALEARDIPQALDTGLFISNLWYLNWSDRSAGRITGMTRFACFWIERGRIVAPVSVMRFDDSLYRLLGDALEALTRDREWRLSPLCWGERSVDTSRIPGALLGALTLTL